MFNALKTKGTAWGDYRWMNPVTNTMSDKSTYIEKVGDVFFTVGIYK